MKQLADDHQLRNLLGAQGRAYVLEHFSDQTISKKWLEFYIQNI
jgi:glycosyltransferase involved in cell wall biosynthesis